MNSVTKLAIALSLAASANAQEGVGTAVDVEDIDARRQLDGYSQDASLAAAPSLDLMAINKPALFDGLAVVDADGAELGRVLSIARHKQTNALHAVVATSADMQRAIPLNALVLDALALWAPENSLAAETFAEADFEPVTQYQSGHTAWGSLRQPADAPDTNQTAQPAPLPGPVVNPIEAQQQALADQAAQHSRSGQAQAPAATNDSPQAYETSSSPIVLLALNQSDALHGRQLLDESGQPIGEIASVAKRISDQELYAVLMRTDATERSVVKLEALTVGRLKFERSDIAWDAQTYEADDFEALGR